MISNTTYKYNAFGKIRTIQNAKNEIEEYKYDLCGNTVWYKDKSRRDVSIVRYTYDSSRRLTEKRTPLEEKDGIVFYAIGKYEYDGAGNLKRQVLTGTKDSKSVREVSYEYYANNLVWQIHDNNGGFIQKSYDKNGNLTEVKTLRNEEENKYDITQYEYDTYNRLTKEIVLVDKGDLFIDETVYDLSELEISEGEYTGKIQLITEHSYDILGNRLSDITPKGHGLRQASDVQKYTTTYTYDVLNRLETVTNKYETENGVESLVTQYYYDAMGNKKVEKITGGIDTIYKIYTYDAMNRLLTVSDGIAADKSGFTPGQEQTVADAEPDALSDIKKSIVYEYDIAGNKVKETTTRDFDKNETITYEYTYDALNRLETVKDPKGNIIKKNIYDANGNIVKVIDAKGYKSASTDEGGYGTIYRYDLANRLTEIIDPETNHYTVKYEYNQFGEKEKQYDGLGHVTQYRYDNAGNLAKVIDAKNIETTYTWDKAGGKLSMADGRGKITRYQYGSGGLLLSITDADEKTATYQYDLEGNITKMTDKNGQEVTYEYNNKNLLTKRKASDVEIRYVYNAFGNRTKMIDGNESTRYKYDDYQRIEYVYDKDENKQLEYKYDDMGNIRTVTVYSQNQTFTTTYDYDECNRMWQVSSGSKTTVYGYDENGNCKIIQYEEGIKEEFEYYKNNKLKSITNYAPTGSILSSYTYTYDLAGRQDSKTDSYGTTRYEYDACGRIEKVTAPGKTTVYTYDGAGNRESLTETYTSQQYDTVLARNGERKEVTYKQKTSHYFYSNANKLLRIVETMYGEDGEIIVLAKAINYGYDDNGNQTHQTVEYATPAEGTAGESFNLSVYTDDQTTGFDRIIESIYNRYDGFNRLIATESIKDGIKTKSEFKYNGDDLRIEKKVTKGDETARVTRYIYSGNYVVAETDENNAFMVKYVRGLGYISRIDGTNKVSYFLYNGHGDVVQTVDKDGNIENQYEYDIFGNTVLTIEGETATHENGGYSNAIRYAGEFYDSETGLYYLRARYYDSYVGRFISEDTFGGFEHNPLSLNRYTYCYNDPIQYVDPTGHLTQQQQKLIQSAINAYNNGIISKEQRDANIRLNGGTPPVDSSPSSSSSKKSSSSSSSSGSSKSGSSSSGTPIYTGLQPDYSNAVWNDYGEIIGYNPYGAGYTVHGTAGTDIHGGGAQAHVAYTDGRSSGSSSSSSSSSNPQVEQAIVNIESAIRAYENGIISREAMEKNVALNQATIATALGNGLSAADVITMEVGGHYAPPYSNTQGIQWIFKQTEKPIIINAIPILQSNLTIGEKTINSYMQNNTVYGEIEGTVEALGGKVRWLNKERTEAEVIYINKDTGKKEKVIYSCNTGDKDFSIIDGVMYIKVREAAQKSGLEDTISWWKDNGIMQVLIQPDMKFAPVQVTRAGDQVNIKAYMNFKGDWNVTPSGYSGTMGDLFVAGIKEDWGGIKTATIFEDFGDYSSVNVNVLLYAKQTSGTGAWDAK